MDSTKRQFPKGFFWGASTSAMQTEGGILNNDWAEAERRGKTPKIRKACDFYNRYESDLDIAKSLHLNAFRFSVEWSRIEPFEGQFNEAELEHYKKVVQATRERGMEPFVCIWHFSLPLWFVKSGSFGRKDAPEIFARYARRVTAALGSEVRYYITINEPMVWLGEHGRILKASPGLFPNPFKAFFYLRQLQKAHRLAYDVMKEVNPHTDIGVASHLIYFNGTNTIGRFIAKIASYFWNWMFLDGIVGYQDFIGVQFYQRISFWQPAKHRHLAIRSDIGWHLHPEALEHMLLHAARYALPLYVVENGIADAKDLYRGRFIEESLKAIHRVIEKNVEVRGYLHWSLLDNYEFTHGYAMRFGLVAVDHNTQERKVRESAKRYGEIARTNTL